MGSIPLLSIFPMSILRARRPSIRSTRTLRHFSFLRRTIETRSWTFSIRSALIARAPVAMVFALMLGVAFDRGRFIDPRRQHFQFDYFFEFKWRFSNE